MSLYSDPMHPDQRSQQLKRAWDAYRGEPKKPLRVRSADADDNLILSLGRLIVDKGVAFLVGQPVNTQITDAQPEPKEDWLAECKRRNRWPILLQKAATNGGIFGHCFLRLLDGQPYPRVVVLDPQTIDIVTDPDDVDTVWSFTITPPPALPTQNDPDLRRRTLITTPSGQAGYRVNGEGWFIIDQLFQGGAWVNQDSTVWPYPFCPVVHCQNIPKPNDFWGESDLPEDVLKVLDGINRIASQYAKIIRLHSHPKIWTRGMGARNLDLSVDSVTHLPSDKAEMRALEMQSDLTSTLALLNKLLELLSMMVRIPLVAMGQPDNLGSISGVALQIRYQPLLEKTEAKRLTYGDLIVETERCLLAMGGHGDQIINSVVWPQVLPSDDLQERQVAVLDDSLGIASKETLSELFGYDYAEEQKRILTERQTAIAAGLAPDPAAVAAVPPPQPLQAPAPDIAKTGKSR